MSSPSENAQWGKMQKAPRETGNSTGYRGRESVSEFLMTALQDSEYCNQLFSLYFPLHLNLKLGF